MSEEEKQKLSLIAAQIFVERSSDVYDELRNEDGREAELEAIADDLKKAYQFAMEHYKNQ